MNLVIRRATLADCAHIARLAMMAGEGIPAYFWGQAAKPGQDLIDVGAINAASETENFSYRNTLMAEYQGKPAAMLLAYRLPDSHEEMDLSGLPEFIRPLIELEQCAPGSFYINMLATYPEYQGLGIGTYLLQQVDDLARGAGCNVVSIEVFAENEGALRLYQRLGYRVVEKRPVIPHPCHPYTGELLLLTRTIV